MASRSRCVAASTRTSMRISSWPPTRSKARSCSARKSLTCSSGGMSPISSKKTLPPWASSSLPSRRSLASVKAPFSWPKSSDSSRVAGMAAAEMPTKGEPARRQRALGEEERLVEVEGLGEVVVGALLHGLDGRLHGAVGGHDHHLRIGALPADAAEEGQPVDARHADVEEDQIEGLRLGLPKRGGAVLDGRDLVAGSAEALLEDPAEAVFVVGDEDAPFGHVHPLSSLTSDGGASL